MSVHQSRHDRLEDEFDRAEDRVRQYLARAEAMLHDSGIIGSNVATVATLAAMLQHEVERVERYRMGARAA